MHTLIRTLLFLSLSSLLGLCLSCNQGPSNTFPEEIVLSFENELVPAIQVIEDPVYFDLVERMNYFKVPGFSIAIIKNGKIEAARGYGFSHKQSKVMVDTNTRFQAASISKSVTALTVIKLRDRNMLDLDVNIEKYLKTWTLPKSRHTENHPITLRLLLNHTAGINNYNSKGFGQEEDLPTLNDVLNGKGNSAAVHIDTIPGRVYKYSNLGYCIVQKVIEDLTGESFKIVAENEVLKPLNMNVSTFKTVRPQNADEAFSHGHDGTGKTLEGSWRNTIRKSAGGLWSTPSNLAKICIAVRRALNGEEGFLTVSSAKELVEGDFGLGFDLQKKEGSVLSFSQSGRAVGFFSYMVIHPKTGDGLVIMANSDNGGNLFREVLRGFSHANSWDVLHPKKIKKIAIAQDKLESYLGEYTCHFEDEIWKIGIRQAGRHLELVDMEENKVYPLRPLTESTFIELTEGDELDFRSTDKASLIWNGKYKFLKKIDNE